MTLNMWREGMDQPEPVQLPRNHGWKVQNHGYRVLVINRGAVMFETPLKWPVTPIGNECLQVSDRRPPNENMRLNVMPFSFPHDPHNDPGVIELLKDTLSLRVTPLDNQSRIRVASRRDLEVAWVEGTMINKEENRLIRSRACMARRNNDFALINCDFYPEFAKRALKAWKVMMTTLQVGEYIEDHTLSSKMN